MKLNFKNILLFIIVFILMGRGLLELIIGKSLAYLVQIIFWFVYIIWIYSYRSRRLNKNSYKYSDIILLCFVIIEFISLFITVLKSSSYGGGLYVGAMSWISTSIYLSYRFESKKVCKLAYDKVISILLLILISIATLQQNHMYLNIPGFTWAPNGDIRPSSITGSYLHYPLITALLAIILLEIGIRLKIKKYILISVLGLFFVFISYSRSGMMLIIATVLIYVLISLSKFIKKLSIKITFRKLMVMYFLFFIIMCYIFLNFDMFLKNEYILRLFSSFDRNSAGNSSRIFLWKSGIDIWLDGAIIFGSNTGEVTNLLSNFGGNSTVVESGIVQQLINFGILGTLLFYLNIIYLNTAINQNFILLNSLIYAAVLQSFIYQSIETIPFMFILSIIPNISTWLLSKLRKQI